MSKSRLVETQRYATTSRSSPISGGASSSSKDRETNTGRSADNSNSTAAYERTAPLLLPAFILDTNRLQISRETGACPS
jgi:hypothetical protein